MREIGLRGRARDVEAADLAADPFEQLARVADDGILRSDGRAQRAGGLVGGPQLVAQRVERTDRFVKRPLSVGDRLEQLLAPRLHLRDFVGSRADPLLELAGRLSQSCHFTGQRRGAFDQSRVRGTIQRKITSKFVFTVTNERSLFSSVSSFNRISTIFSVAVM